MDSNLSIPDRLTIRSTSTDGGTDRALIGGFPEQ